MRRLAGLAVFCILLLNGCKGFFTPQTGGNGGGGTGNTTAGDVLYFMNTAGLTISGYLVSTTGTLSAVAGSPYSIGTVPTSMAVTPGNTFLYVGYVNGILGYSIGANGKLSVLNSSQPLSSAQVTPLSMQVDTTGLYLLAASADLTTTPATPLIGIYQINATTGALTPVTGSPLRVAPGNGSTATNPANAPTSLYITPNNKYVYLTLGSGGTEILTFSATGGVLTDTKTHMNLAKGGFGQIGVTASAGTTTLFLTETGVGVRAFTIAAGGALTEVTGSPFKTGNGPNGVILDPTGDYLYVTNKGDNTINGYSVAPSGTLTTLASSPYSTGGLPLSLATNQSKKFIAVANSAGNPDLAVYSYDATSLGKLDQTATQTATTTQATVLVVGTR